MVFCMKRILITICLFLVGFVNAQQTDYVDFLRIEAGLRFVPDSSKVLGIGTYTFKILKAVDSVFIDAKNINFNEVLLLDETLNDFSFSYQNNKLWLKYPFKKGNDYELFIDYDAAPKKALYVVNRKGDYQIWTQGQGKYTSHWLPSFDDANEKIEFHLSFSFRPGYKIMSNGKLDSQMTIFDPDKQIVHYKMQKPMPSYLVAFVIGKYNKKTDVSKSGVPLEFYYYPEDSLKFESTYRYSKRMFDFLEEEIGFPYPWQNYKQVPVHDFLYAGMENTSLTIFSDGFVVDSTGFNDKNYVNVNAHELAHQWFGDLVTATSGEHHWLQEGFATYYALLAEREVFGNDYFFFKLYESAVDLGKQDIVGSGTSLLNPKSSSLTFYQRGAWVLHALRTKLGGNVFRQAVINYLKKHQFANVKTSDFVSEVERLHGRSLSGFVNQWIKQKPFPVDEAFSLLKKQSTFINEYLMIDCEAKNSKCEDYLKYYASDEAKAKVISQMPELVTTEAFKEGLKVRQAISKYVTKIPKALKADYETLLEDKSYVTVENALYNLWNNFPEDRSKYLSKTSIIHGFSDKNVRLLWIALNLNTPFYQADNKQALYSELLSYTDSHRNADLRISAFQYLDMMKACNEACKENLEDAKSHHNWRLVKFAKQLSEKLQQSKN